MIYKVKISVCFYEKALKNRTISRYDRTIQGNISKKVSHYFKRALFEVALIKVFLYLIKVVWCDKRVKNICTYSRSPIDPLGSIREKNPSYVYVVP